MSIPLPSLTTASAGFGTKASTSSTPDTPNLPPTTLLPTPLQQADIFLDNLVTTLAAVNQVPYTDLPQTAQALEFQRQVRAETVCDYCSGPHNRFQCGRPPRHGCICQRCNRKGHGWWSCAHGSADPKTGVSFQLPARGPRMREATGSEKDGSRREVRERVHRTVRKTAWRDKTAKETRAKLPSAEAVEQKKKIGSEGPVGREEVRRDAMQEVERAARAIERREGIARERGRQLWR